MNNTKTDNKKQEKVNSNLPKAFIKGFVNAAGYSFFGLVNILRPPYLFIRKRARQNKEINLAKSLKFPLNGQGLGELKDLRIGCCNFAHSGCGAVATFNALSMAGLQPDMAEIVDFYEHKGLTFYAKFGVNPIAVNRYLATKELEWRRYSKPTELKEGQCAILLYWWANASGCAAHYVAAEKTENGIRVYNVYNTKDKAYEYKDVQAFLNSGSYKKVVAMFVIDKKESQTT